MKLYFYLMILLFFTLLNAHSAVEVNTITLNKTKPEDSFFEGVVHTSRSEIFDFDVSGKLLKIKRPGDYVLNPILNNQGKVIRKGTVIASLSKKQFEYNIKTQKMNIEIAKSALTAAKSNMARATKLINSQAISQKEFESYNSEYVKAKLSLSRSYVELGKLENQTKSCELVAPFSGIVEAVYAAPGSWVNNDDKVVRLTRINPLVIKIHFPEDIINNFTREQVVRAYSMFSDKPVPTWVDRSLLTGELLVFVSNSLVFDKSLDSEQKKLPKALSIFPVLHITAETKEIMGLRNIENPFGKNVPLGIPMKAIKKDTKGHFVVRIKGAKAFSIDKGVPDEFYVEKVYFTPGDISRDFFLGKGYSLKIISAKDPGKLSPLDILVLSSEPENIEDGSKVIYGNYVWKFYPGRKVKVEIPSLTPRAFYIPANALITKGISAKYVYIAENGKAKLVRVKIVGIYGNLIAVESPELIDGVKLILMKNNQDYTNIFDGCEITAK